MAASLAKRLLATSISIDQDTFYVTLLELLEDFVETRNPIYPRQDVLKFLVKSLSLTPRVVIIKLILKVLAEFCTESANYDHLHIRRLLITLRTAKMVCVILARHLRERKVDVSEQCINLLKQLGAAMLPTELTTVTTELLPICLSICDVNKSYLFRHKDPVIHRLKDYLVGKTLLMKQFKYNHDTSKEKSTLLHSLFECSSLQIRVVNGEFFDAKNKNIVQQLGEENLVWIQKEDDLNYEYEPERKIIPSSLIRDRYFFAHDVTNLKQVKDIEQVLQDEHHTSLSGKPSPGELVTVNGIINSPYSDSANSHIYYRAQIVRITQSRNVAVIALDYGLLKTVDKTQLYLPCQSLLHILPTSIICSISGVHPLPLSVKILEDSLSIMQLLVSGNYTISEALVNLSALTILMKLTSVCSTERLSVKIMNLLLHISQFGWLRSTHFIEKNPVMKLMTLMRQYSVMKWRDAITAAANTLSAICYNNPSVSNQFKKGIPCLLHLVSKFGDDPDLTQTLLLICRNFVGDVAIAPCIGILLDEQTPQCYKYNSGASPPSVDSACHSYVSSCNESFSSSENESGYGRVSRVRSRSSSRNLAKSRSSSRHRPINLLELGQQHSNQPAGDLRRLSISTAYTPRESYIQGESTGIVTTRLHEVFDSSIMMQCANVLQHVVGFLNAGINGRIFYGLAPSDGTVVGVVFDRDQRDQLRLGLDRSCRDLLPPPIFVPSVKFIPVCLSKEPGSFLNDRFVVEVEVTSDGLPRGYMIRNDNRIFLREGKATVTCTTQQIREVITSTYIAHQK